MAQSCFCVSVNAFAFGSIVILFVAMPTNASHFLPRLPVEPTPDVVDPDFVKMLLPEIEAVVGTGIGQSSFTERRLGLLEEALRTTYAAVPKNEHGRVGHDAASYVLHRLFLQRYAWSVEGLDPVKQAEITKSSSGRSASWSHRVPEHILSLFEVRLGGRGLGRKELAVYAATIEHLIHTEAIGRLQATYKSHGFSLQSVLSDADVEMVMDSYMAYFILGAHMGEVSKPTAAKVKQSRDMVEQTYPEFNETQKFLRDVKERTAPHRGHMYFADVVGVVEEVGELYGRWQDNECRLMKEMLVEAEDNGPTGGGRVRLADFYRKALYEGKWQFGENEHALRQMGAIDDSDPTDLRLIIPNYVYSPTNCLAGSVFYSVCCIDECDDLLANIESTFARPDLSVTEIASHVAAMPSTTVPSNRTLSIGLLHRLDEIAAYHDGRVPLHGRLFAQWMHHAYPRECRYPPVAGTTDPISTAFGTYNDVSNSATTDEMQRYIDAAESREVTAASAANVTEVEACSMWTMTEELAVSPTRAPMLRRLMASSVLKGATVVGALASTLLATIAHSLTHSLKPKLVEKYYL